MNRLMMQESRVESEGVTTLCQEPGALNIVLERGCGLWEQVKDGESSRMLLSDSMFSLE